ncbi:hypothetical protein JZ751_002028 [Albula glossodonta]|uniref:Uncharacterized protein n=1 Tax=Albula glossodonta TaxID=121402 RepID=A0A8T2P4A1_9TELE|nr:hypothetical protein JZ751_002028 [Albula glossodonta]
MVGSINNGLNSSAVLLGGGGDKKALFEEVAISSTHCVTDHIFTFVSILPPTTINLQLHPPSPQTPTLTLPTPQPKHERSQHCERGLAPQESQSPLGPPEIGGSSPLSKALNLILLPGGIGPWLA